MCLQSTTPGGQHGPAPHPECLHVYIRVDTCENLWLACLTLLGTEARDSERQFKKKLLSTWKLILELRSLKEKVEWPKMMEKTTMTETWLRKHRLLYVGATRHPFIHSIRDGNIDLSSFKTWLGQDYVFVRAFVPFVASVLTKAWKGSDDSSNDMEVILGGMAALNDEIAWFKKEASKWGVQLSNIVHQKANQDYCRFLESLMSPEVEYTVAIVAFWAIEAVYQESFAHCLEDGGKTPRELQETCQRWGNAGFGHYCNSLRQIADRQLETASHDVITKAEVTFLRILEQEVDFWNMSHGGT